MRDRGARGRTTSSRAVIDGVRLFKGITDATMGHGEGWQYLQVGTLSRAIERDRLAARRSSCPRGPARQHGEPHDQVEWVTLLHSCSALEAYCRYYTADVRSERVTEFLLLNPRVSAIGAFLGRPARSRAPHAGRLQCPHGGRAERLAGRLRASLEYAQVDEILSDDPQAYLLEHQPAVQPDSRRRSAELRLVSDRVGACLREQSAARRYAVGSRPTCATPSDTSRASPTSRPSPRA